MGTAVGTAGSGGWDSVLVAASSTRDRTAGLTSVVVAPNWLKSTMGASSVLGDVLFHRLGNVVVEGARGMVEVGSIPVPAPVLGTARPEGGAEEAGRGTATDAPKGEAATEAATEAALLSLGAGFNPGSAVAAVVVVLVLVLVLVLLLVLLLVVVGRATLGAKTGKEATAWGVRLVRGRIIKSDPDDASESPLAFRFRLLDPPGRANMPGANTSLEMLPPERRRPSSCCCCCCGWWWWWW